MPSHEYSPREALALLIKKIRARDSDLAIGLQAAIDAGTDVLERDTITTARRPRKYRKTVRLTDEQALRVAMRALEAYFVEQPLFAVSAVSEFANATLDAVSAQQGGSSLDQPPSESSKAMPLDVGLELEVHTETQLAQEDGRIVRETVPFSPPPQELLKEQKANIEHLSELLGLGPR